jgi:microcystin-dependent protein
MPGSTPHWGLPYPLGAENPAIHTAIQLLAASLDDVTKYSQGPASARPISTVGSPGIAGRFYYATDSLILYYDFGTGWQAMGPDTGDIRMVGYDVIVGTSEPAGWLLCDGREVPRTGLTQALWNKISSLHGNGDGSTTFNLPDFRGRSPMGKGQGSGMTLRTVGQKPGAEEVQLALDQMPSHDHNNGNHAHGMQSTGHLHTPPGAGTKFAVTAEIGEGLIGNLNAGSVPPYNLYRSGGTAFAVAGSTSDYSGVVIPFQGGGQAHANVHPSTVVSVLIKT